MTVHHGGGGAYTIARTHGGRGGDGGGAVGVAWIWGVAGGVVVGIGVRSILWHFGMICKSLLGMDGWMALEMDGIVL